MELSLVSVSLYFFLTFNTLEKTTNLSENVDPELVASMRDGLAGTLGGIPKRNEH